MASSKSCFFHSIEQESSTLALSKKLVSVPRIPKY